jgi:hypothetical protein
MEIPQGKSDAVRETLGAEVEKTADRLTLTLRNVTYRR